MELKEFTEITQNVLSMIPEEQRAAASVHFTNLTEAFTESVTSVGTLTAANEKLTNDNKSLIEVNGRLLLKVGNPVTQVQQTEQQTEEQEIPKITINELFDEKGVLK